MANDVLEQIYERIDRASLLPELEPLERGNTLQLRCPQCGQREAFLYQDGTRILCNRRNKCGYSESLWDYLSHRDRLSPRETLALLAANAHVELGSATSLREAESTADRQQALEKAISIFQAALFAPEGRRTLEYLQNRGWGDEAIRAAGFGHYPMLGTLRGGLGGDAGALEGPDYSLFTPTALGDTHTLVIPYRDGYGRPLGVIVRTVEPLAHQGRKYLFNRGVKRGQWLFGMDRIPKGDSVVICEGFLDALMAQAHGIENAVATGGSRLTSAQLSHAQRRGVKRFILALDNAMTDKAGREGALAAIADIQAAGGAAYIAEIPEGYKDPDEVLRAGETAENAFKGNIARPTSAAGWAARMLLKNFELPTGEPIDAVKRDRVLDEAMRYAAKLGDPISPADFMAEIAATLRLPERTLALAYESYAQRELARKQRQQLNRLSSELPRILQAQGNDGAIAHLKSQLSEIEQGQRDQSRLRPYTAEELLRDLKDAPDGMRTGYRSLDALLTIPQAAITLVAARPSHGKTTLLTNLFLRMIETYPEGSFAFFSYEETRVALALNMINILAGFTLHQRKNKYAIQRYFRDGGDERGLKVPALEQAWQTFAGYVESGRLKLFEENLDAESLAQSIQAEKKRNPSLQGVFIDYIQKVKWEGANTNSRQVELQRISGRLLEAAKETGLPIILAAQLGRPAKSRDAREDTRKGIRLDNLRESGDIEQDANLVLGLFNEAMDRSEEDGSELSGAEQHLTVTILKNRNGIAGATVPLRFTPQVLRVEDLPKSTL